MEVDSKKSSDKSNVVLAGSPGGTAAPDPEQCVADAMKAFSATLNYLAGIVGAGGMIIAPFTTKNKGELIALESACGFAAIVSQIGRKIYLRQQGVDNVTGLWVRAYNSCGRPGGGLKDKLKNWRLAPIRSPQLQTSPGNKRVPVSLPEIDFRLPKISPEFVGAAALVEAMILGGMIILSLAGI